MFFVVFDVILSPRDGLQWRVSCKKASIRFSPTGESYRLLHSGSGFDWPAIHREFSRNLWFTVRPEVEIYVYD